MNKVLKRLNKFAETFLNSSEIRKRIEEVKDVPIKNTIYFKNIALFKGNVIKKIYIVEYDSNDFDEFKGPIHAKADIELDIGADNTATFSDVELSISIPIKSNKIEILQDGYNEFLYLDI